MTRANKAPKAYGRELHAEWVKQGATPELIAEYRQDILESFLTDLGLNDTKVALVIQGFDAAATAAATSRS